MDCDKLNLNINSGCNRSVGGIKKVWLMTKPLTDLQWNEKERLLITDYNIENLPVEISPNERTSTFDMNVDNNQNVISYVNRLVINFPLIESEKKHGLDKMLSNDIYIIFLDSNNQYFYMTPDFGGRCTNLIGETGSKGGSNYYSLEFVSNSRRHIPEIFGFSVDCGISFGPNTFFPTSFRSEVTFSDDIPLPVNIDLFYEGNNFIKTFVANTNPYEVFYVKGTSGAPVSATSYTLVVSGLTSCPDTTKVLYPTPDPIRDDKTTSEFFVIGNGTTLQVEASDNFSGIKNSFINIDGLQFPLYTKESYELISDTTFISGTSSNKFYTLKDDFSTDSFLTGLTEQMSDIKSTPYDIRQTLLETPISDREQVRFKLQTPIKDGYGPFILSNTSMGYENQNTNHNNFNFPNSHNWATNIKLYSLDGYYSEVTDGVGNSISGNISVEDLDNNGLVLYNIEEYTENVSIDNIGVEFGYLSPYTTATTFNYQTKPTITSVFDIVNTLEPFNYNVTNFSSEYEKDLYYFWYNNEDFLPNIITVTLSGSSGQETYTYNHSPNTTSDKFTFEDTHFYTEFLRDIGITVHTLYVSEFDVSGNTDVRFNLYCSIDKDIEIVSITEFNKEGTKEIWRNKLNSNPNPQYRITWSGVPTTDFGVINYDADDYSEGINLYEYTQFGTGYTVDYNNGTDVMTITENAATNGVKFTTYTSSGECLTNNQTFNPTLTITGFSNTLKTGTTLGDVDYYYLNDDSYLLYGDANPIDLTSNYNHNVPVLTNDYKLGLWGLPHDYYYVGSVTNITPTLYGNHSAISGNCQSLNFDGVAEYIDCTNNSVFNFNSTDPFSFESWVKFDNVSGFNFLTAKVDFGGVPVARGYYFGTEGNQLKFLFFNTNTTLMSVKSVQTVSTGVWYHVIMTYDGSGNASGVKYYLDDTLLTNTILSDTLIDPTTTTVPLQIGGQSPSFLGGNIARSRIWDIELTSGEVTTMYNGGCINYSPIQTGNLILDLDITNSSWNGSEYDVTDLSSTNATCQTVSMEITDLETDCPC